MSMRAPFRRSGSAARRRDAAIAGPAAWHAADGRHSAAPARSGARIRAVPGADNHPKVRPMAGTSGAEACSEVVGGGLDDGRDDRFNLFLHQAVIVRPEDEPPRQALLARGERRPAIDVEQRDVAHETPAAAGSGPATRPPASPPGTTRARSRSTGAYFPMGVTRGAGGWPASRPATASSATYTRSDRRSHAAGACRVQLADQPDQASGRRGVGVGFADRGPPAASGVRTCPCGTPRVQRGDPGDRLPARHPQAQGRRHELHDPLGVVEVDRPRRPVPRRTEPRRPRAGSPAATTRPASRRGRPRSPSPPRTPPRPGDPGARCGRARRAGSRPGPARRTACRSDSGFVTRRPARRWRPRRRRRRRHRSASRGSTAGARPPGPE